MGEREWAREWAREWVREWVRENEGQGEGENGRECAIVNENWRESGQECGRES